MKYADFLENAIKAAISGGRLIMEVYESLDFEVEEKDDLSPLTRADKLSHEEIKKSLRDTGLPFLSEEGRDIEYSERKDWQLFWMVDPLDGTKEFIKRNGEFTVNIAMIDKNRPVAGVIYIPASGRLFIAHEGEGAYKCSFNVHVNPDDFQLADFTAPSMRMEVPVTSEETPVIIASRSHLSDETGKFIQDAKSKYGQIETVSVGSSIKFCMLAEGKASLYPRFAPTMEWDTAAGQIIAAETGFETIVPETRKPLRYNKESLLNPWFIVKPVKFDTGGLY